MPVIDATWSPPATSAIRLVVLVDPIERMFQPEHRVRLEHWFNRRDGVSRDVFMLRTPTAGRCPADRAGAGGREVVHYFDREDDARALLKRMLEAVPAELSNWARMTAQRSD
jgi:hypothetical protein